MLNHKKVAMLIVRGLADFDPSEESSSKDQDKTPKDDKPYESRMGVEYAMDKFIRAVHEKDTKRAIEAMMEFQEMCSGSEYIKKDESSEEKDEY